MKENWELILRAGEVIAAAVELPGLRITEEESKRFEGVSDSSHNS